MVVSNSGESKASNVLVEDSLQEGLKYRDLASQTRKWTIGDLNPGSSKTLNYSVIVASDAATGSYNNIVSVSADNYEKISFTHTLNVTGEVAGEDAVPVLDVVKTADKSSANPGDNVNYTVSITNTGEAPAINIKIKDSLPPGFQLSNGNTTVDLVVEEVAIGETVKVDITANIPQGTASGQYTNIAHISADNIDGEVEARHTLQVVQGKVLGDTGIGGGMWMIIMSAIALIVAGSFQLRRQSAFSFK